MFSDKLISDCSILNRLDYDDFMKTINYSFNLILHQQNTIKITQFIEISQDNGQKLTQITLNLIHGLSSFNYNSNLIQQKIRLIRLDRQRGQYIKNKINENLYELRKIIYDRQLNDLTQIQKIDWRFQIQVASKSCKNIYNPNILIHLRMKNNYHNNNQQQRKQLLRSIEEQNKKQSLSIQNKKYQDVLFNSDFGNLKNLQYQLNQALKMHNNNKFKVAKNSTL